MAKIEKEENIEEIELGQPMLLCVNPDDYKEGEGFRDVVIGFEKAFGKDSGKPYIILKLESGKKIRQYSFEFATKGKKLSEILGCEIKFIKIKRTNKFLASLYEKTKISEEIFND